MSGLTAWMRTFVLLIVLLLGPFGLWPLGAQAGVRIDFYSKNGHPIPHAYIALSGALDADGTVVDENFGFTPHFVAPPILTGFVKGKVASADAEYVKGGVLHFSMQLSDDEYRRVMAVVEDWRTRPQPSYHLDRANCVGFVAAIGQVLGLDAAPDAATVRHPRAYLAGLARRNATVLAARASPPEPSQPAVAAAANAPEAVTGSGR